MIQNLPYFWITHVVFLFVFHYVLLYFFPSECPGLCRHRLEHSLGEKNKVAWSEKWKKHLWVFVYRYIKYGKFWSISLELFIEHKPWNWEELYSKFFYSTPPKKIWPIFFRDIEWTLAHRPDMFFSITFCESSINLSILYFVDRREFYLHQKKRYLVHS